MGAMLEGAPINDGFDVCDMNYNGKPARRMPFAAKARRGRASADVSRGSCPVPGPYGVLDVFSLPRVPCGPFPL